MLKSKEALAVSTEMEPVEGTVDINIPVSVLWECFAQPQLWPSWNKCFWGVYNKHLILGGNLLWGFEPIKWWYFYKLFAIAKIVELEENHKVTWEVSAFPGFYARHTYFIEDIGNNRSRFGSYEKAMGWSFRLMKGFWLAHFIFVKDKSLEGAAELEKLYQTKGQINKATLKPKKYGLFLLTITLLISLLIGVGVLGWFYNSYLRLRQVNLAPGIYAELAGGGNSLIVQNDKSVLLVDTKFPPGANLLKNRIAEKVGEPGIIVNTHYHYDHTQGNILYPEAKIFAHKNVPDLMKKRDGEWWGKYPNSIPHNLFEESAILKIGQQEVILTYAGKAHTHGDIWVYLRKDNVEIIALGDLLFHTYYPFMDLGEGGIDITLLIKSIRELASKYPNATFIPGHGPLAKATDLIQYADYLEFLYRSVEQARKDGLSEDQAVKMIDLSKWDLSILPSYHKGTLCWATAGNNIRWIYRLQMGNFDPHQLPCNLW